jgi:hypothetical protein
VPIVQLRVAARASPRYYSDNNPRRSPSSQTFYWTEDKCFRERCCEFDINWSALPLAVERNVKAALNTTLSERLGASGAVVYRGTGYFTDAHTIRVRLAAGHDEVSLRAENILIAALPHVLPKVRHKRGHWHHNRAETPTSQRANGRGASAGSSHRSRRSDFFPFTAPSILIFALGIIASLLPDRGRSVGNVSSSRTRRQQARALEIS